MDIWWKNYSLKFGFKVPNLINKSLLVNKTCLSCLYDYLLYDKINETFLVKGKIKFVLRNLPFYA